MNKEKVQEYIENIEQLGADTRYWFNQENNDNTKKELESLIYWCNKALKELKKEDK